jgi:hypothetical protein
MIERGQWWASPVALSMRPRARRGGGGHD